MRLPADHPLARETGHTRTALAHERADGRVCMCEPCAGLRAERLDRIAVERWPTRRDAIAAREAKAQQLRAKADELELEARIARAKMRDDAANALAGEAAANA